MVNAFLASTVMQDSVKRYCLLKKCSEANGLLDETTVWEDELSFEAAERHDTSAQIQTAEQSGTESGYTLFVDRSIRLHRGDRIRRETDGVLLTVTTDSTDAQAPAASGMNLCAVSCRKGVLDE